MHGNKMIYVKSLKQTFLHLFSLQCENGSKTGGGSIRTDDTTQHFNSESRQEHRTVDIRTSQ